mmetsp:Transcript_12747/g.22919  ORF Transcript_12747/g.22919 Transcript_12747/m.22919 type:complete len:83 (-) Transcript_12747:1591-1839(-)
MKKIGYMCFKRLELNNLVLDSDLNSYQVIILMGFKNDGVKTAVAINDNFTSDCVHAFNCMISIACCVFLTDDIEELEKFRVR